MQVEPFGKNILIKPREKAQILVSDQGMLTEYGDVQAVGSEVKNVKVGDVVGFTVWGIQALQVEDSKFYLVPEDDKFILAKINVQE